ncbi:hypothetical protein ABS767_15655 [Sphingomonas sp. ST-64]|uniref:Uncharacterized protein n=1 Tax=Sphingomonas plantiphila TaxID=3163295 RepID=A0ABW8YQ51_9SPHN
MDDRDYYRERAARSRELAQASKDASARHAHLTLAERYDRLASGEKVELTIVERG